MARKTAVELVREYFESKGQCLVNISNEDIESVLLCEAAKVKGYSEIKNKKDFLYHLACKMIQKISKQ